MADDQDPASKTEEPTGKRLADNYRKGNIARSSDLNHGFMLLAAGIVLVMFGGTLVRGIAGRLAPFLGGVHAIPADAAGLRDALLELAYGIAWTLAPVLAILVVFAIAANVVQNPPGLAWEKLKPDIARLSPMGGVKKLFSLQNTIETAKGLLKIAIVGTVALLLVAPRLHELPQLVFVDPGELLGRVEYLVLVMLAGVIAVMSIVAAADLLYQRFSHRQRLRMTKSEVKDEHKDTDGDPQVKARLRSIRIERARKRMMAAVPTADVVVTNPTHYAVALKYEQADMEAPTVVAKGVDAMAQRIRELATEHKVPIVENPPLARALYTVELDREIPAEHYKAVAEIISYVFRLKGRMPARRVRPDARPDARPGR